MEKNIVKSRLALIFSQRATNCLLAAIAIMNFWFYFHIGASDNLQSDFDDSLYITQEWGNIHFYQTISVKNIGKDIGYLNKIKAFIRSKDSDQRKFARKLDGKSYFNDILHNYSPLLEIPLNTNEQFNSEINLFNSLGRFEDDSTSIYSNLAINEAERVKKKEIKTIATVGELSKKTAQKITAFIYNRMADFRQGEYEYIIQLYKDDEKDPFVTKGYSFTIYQANIEALKESIKTYNEYNILNNGIISRPSIQVRLTEIQDHATIENLSKECK